MAAMVVSNVCPICGNPVERQYRPFCSRRCADVDLHRWLSGVYAVPVVPEEEEQDVPGSGPDAVSD